MESDLIRSSDYYAAFDEAESSFGLTDPAAAKVRRDVISPLFSRRAIMKLETVIQDKVRSGCQKLPQRQFINACPG